MKDLEQINQLIEINSLYLSRASFGTKLFQIIYKNIIELEFLKGELESKTILIEDWCDLYEGEGVQDNSHYC